MLYTIDNPAIVVSALKKRETGNGYILRVYESEGKPQQGSVSFPGLGIQEQIALEPFEIVTYQLNTQEKTLEKTQLLELDV